MKKTNNLSAFILLFPAFFCLFLFNFYPILRNFYLSFTSWDMVTGDPRFIGLENYLDIFRDQFFGIAFGNTILYALLSTILQEGLGLAFALFLNSKFKGRTIVRTIIYLPMIISALLVGYIMMFFFQYHYGVINEVLQWLGMEPIDWLRDPVRGRLIISLVTGWHYSGSSMIIFMAGLQNIPSMYVEAAKLDGANKRQLFMHVTLPLLQPAMASTVTLNMIGGLKIYDSIISLTNGGPVQKTNSLSTLISYVYFTSEKAGYASAIGIFQFVFIFVVSFLINQYFKKREVQY